MRLGFAATATVACWLALGTSALAQGYSSEEAPRRMTVADGFEVQLVAAEPVVRQPVAIEFDDRGRLWVIQYLQYPNPAGLKRVKVDRYSRTQYDRVPEPPPRGPRGDDRITILEDTDGDGRADRGRDFVDGLNLASGLAFGYGGVFVLNAPYLLFYADRNRDDVPDAAPEVLLTGFGMEDAHSVANSLTWGPDGWLYGTQGSTVTANIRGIEFQQGVWRYHPVSHRFELFCEGGGNSWGLDFDAAGELLYSTNFGGYVMLHGVPGGYYWKNFGKHGVLHNPYAFGYFDHVPHQNFTGGHVTVGGVVYQSDLFPREWRGRYIAADLLGHAVYWHTIRQRGSTYQSAHGGTLLAANDTWFAPSDVTIGPDGAVYVADWHDARTAHPDPDAEWDRRNGRVYRIQPRGAKRPRARDLRDATSDELVDVLSSTNEWYVRRARMQLAERRDPNVIPKLAARIPRRGNRFDDEQKQSLDALWALYCCGGFNEEVGVKLLADDRPAVRGWAVRLFGENGSVSPAVVRRMGELADADYPVVLRQLACTARKLPPADCLSILEPLWRNDTNFDDPYIPLLVWWALETWAVPAVDDVVLPFAAPRNSDRWVRTRATEFLLPRLVQRYASERDPASADACRRLIAAAPSGEGRQPLYAALDEGLRSRGTQKDAQLASRSLRDLVAGDWQHDPDNETLTRLAARLGVSAALEHGVARALDQKTVTDVRVRMLRVLGEVGRPEDFPRLVPLLAAKTPEEVQAAALRGLARASDGAIAQAILAACPSMSAAARAAARDVLLAKRNWAALFLARVDAGEFDARDVPVEAVRVVAAHGDEALDALVRKYWGAVHTATPEERLAVVRRLNNDLRAAAGHAEPGQALFKKHCATCHRLFGEGESIGPDLTTANRQDRDFLLASIVDPATVVRKEYLSYNVQTTDGRVLTGLIVEQDAGGVTLLSAKNERVRVARSEIDSLAESPNSLMPDTIAEQLSPQELRDLFAWLQQSPPVASAK
ncbi:MAG: c-type cytochrome [Planctomycetia bacterium]|nr:c-type cytochrome [Planctomycetia bacterium]